MKSKISKPGKEINFYQELSKRDKVHLKYILSPLELAALRHNFLPFNFRFEGKFIYFSSPACKQLMDFTRSKIGFVINRIERERKSVGIPLKLRNTFEDPAEILGLPDYTRKHLCRIECYTMFGIMVLGREYFLNRKEFGKQSIKVIDDLFIKYRCGHLFK